MSGSNTFLDKMDRDYNRIILAILDEKPLWMILARINEFQNTYRQHLELQRVSDDAGKRVIHYQAGRVLPIRKDSFVCQKIEAEARRNGHFAREMMQYHQKADNYPIEPQKDISDFQEYVLEQDKSKKKSMEELVK